MDLPIIVVEHHALRRRGIMMYLAWLGLPATLWLGEGRPPAGRAAVVCVADGPAKDHPRLDARGLRAVAVLRHAYPSVPIVGYSLLPVESLSGLRDGLGAKRIELIAPLGHLDDLIAALRRTMGAAL